MVTSLPAVLAAYMAAAAPGTARMRLPPVPAAPADVDRQASYQAWLAYKAAMAARAAGQWDTALREFETEAALYWFLAAQPAQASQRHTLLLDTAASLNDAAAVLRARGLYNQAAALYQAAQPLWEKVGYPQMSFYSLDNSEELGTRFRVYAVTPGTVTLPGGKFVPSVPGMYLGAYVELDPRVGGNYFGRFNGMMGRDFAGFLEYLPWGDPFPTTFVRDCARVGAAAQIAWEPTQGLAAVGPTPYVKAFLKAAASTHVPIFLRFGAEMNGPWVSWYGNPPAFVAAWRRLAVLVRRYAPNVALVWSPDVQPQADILSYYPGDSYVDWVGVSDYVPYASRQGDRVVVSPGATLLNQLDYVYRHFARIKPIMISEGAVAHASTLVRANLVPFAESQYRQLFADIPLFYPDVRALFLFDVNTPHHPTPGIPPSQATSDFSLTDDPRFLAFFRRLLRDLGPYFLSRVTPDTGTARVTQAAPRLVPVTASAPARPEGRQVVLVSRVHVFGASRVWVTYVLGGRRVTVSQAPYRAVLPLPSGHGTLAGRAVLFADGHPVAAVPIAVELPSR